MTMANFDDREFIAFRNHLHNWAKKGVSFANRAALNTSAFEARREWKEEIESSMVLRNTWTTRTLKVVKARGSIPARMESVIGSTLDYMGLQEKGGTIRKKGKHGHPIPTTMATGEGRGAQPRRRRPRRPNRLGNINLQSRARRAGRKQRNAIAIKLAAAAGTRYLFLELPNNRAGVFRLFGGKRRPRVEMLWDLSRPSVRVKPNPTLARTMKAITPRLPRIHIDAIKQQLRFHRVTGF